MARFYEARHRFFTGPRFMIGGMGLSIIHRAKIGICAREGYLCGFTGLGRPSENPYFDGIERSAWRRGYDEGRIASCRGGL